MLSSLFAGISGLNANATAMTVIGDNIANVNTIAYKANQISFSNVLSTSLTGSDSSDIGRGVNVWDTNGVWTQGSMQGTGRATDLSVNGIGFFIVTDENGSQYYTRAGQFYLNELGDMVNPDGLHVMGYEIDATGALGGLSQISIPGDRLSPPQATTEFSFDVNLDAGAQPADTFSAAQTIYDSLGNAIEVTLTFTNVASNQWTVDASVPASVGGPVTINGAASIPVTFDANGNLIAPAADANVSIVLTNGATSPQTVTWDLYDALGNSNGDLTGYANPSSMTFQYQDGYPAGVLRGISVDDDGTISANYSNGRLVPVYMLALADFPSYEGLDKMGGNLYAESLESGQPLQGIPGNGRLGNISPSTIEMSNVDLAKEFVDMITVQRAFQANSRVITTSDEILAELINIKR
ncbi:MAG: flagellar hook protein FlgE [Desulfobacterales bacterium]|nr:MAG: flagellar hook protein FlgE [Desulfobacterales bacterium]